MVEKLNRIKVEEKLKSLGLPLFTPREFRDIFGVSEKTATTFIGRNVKSGLFLKLRNNYYLIKDSHPSHYAIANKLYQPSYISLETALSYYGMIPETVYATASVTTKPTREFITPLGAFSYQRIKIEAFTGYRPMQLDGMTVLFAEPEKALVDYLYFVDLKYIRLNDRLELRKVNKQKALQFANLFNRPGLITLLNHAYAEQKNPRIIY